MFICIGLPGYLRLSFGFEIIFFIFLPTIISGIIYLISIIVCCWKIRKLNTNQKVNHIITIMLVLLLLPILIFFVVFFREIYLLNNNNLILISSDRSNSGGFTDTTYNTIHIITKDNSIKEVSIGAENIENFLNKSFKEVQIYKYIIEYNDIMKSNEYTIESTSSSSYFTFKEDKNLAEINKNKIKNIMLDIKNNKLNKDKYFYLTYFKDIDYYIINEYIYIGDKYISKLNSPGIIRNAFILKSY